MFPKSKFYTIEYQESEEDFQNNRIKGLGGSDAASILGYSPWMSNVDLYMDKIGEGKPFVTNDYVEFGNDMEPLIHDMFYLQNKEYKPYNTKGLSFLSTEHPYIRANLDGFMEDENGKFGILEIKTVQSNFAKWYHSEIPINYLSQLIHYMYVMNADFAIMYAFFNTPFRNDGQKAHIKQIRFERADYQDSIDYLVKKEINFWENNVMKKIKPALSVEL